MQLLHQAVIAVTAESRQDVENMEREMGFEPTASSLGIQTSFDNKELMRQRRQILNIQVHADSAFCEIAPPNAVIAVTRGILL
jgi:hypothetical protein